MDKELFDLVCSISNTNAKKCMLCGKCSARCPNFDSFDIKPHQFVNMIAKGKFDILFESKTIYKCLSCLECVERCPRNVAPGHLIDAIKELVVRKKDNTMLSENDVCELVEEDMPQQLLVSAFRKFN